MTDWWIKEALLGKKVAKKLPFFSVLDILEGGKICLAK
jgi:hypothetical protein